MTDATSIAADSAEFHIQQAQLRAKAGDIDGAVQSYRHAYARNPHYPRLRIMIAKISDDLAEVRQALAFDPVAAESAEWAPAWCHLAELLIAHGRGADALAAGDVALHLSPRAPGALITRARALFVLSRYDEALACAEQAVGVDPQSSAAQSLLAGVLMTKCDRGRALAAFDASLRLNPGSADVRMERVMATLPIIPEDCAEVLRSRQEFADSLAAFEQWLAAGGGADPATSVGAHMPFYLAYQPLDNRELISAHGRLCVRLMDEWRRRRGLTGPPTRARRVGRLRIGIASAFFSNHSVFHALVGGWLRRLDRRQIEIAMFHVGSVQDAQTGFCRASADHFVQGPKGLADWVHEIQTQALDVLIYPEIGMEKTTLQLASLRLAPTQVAAWGHPQTTGLPTIDYFLSAERFESAAADAHYSERLIRLPHLGTYIERPQAAPAAAPRSPNSEPIFLCPGTPFKYSPDDDPLFVSLAQRLGQCQFLFFRYKGGVWSERLIRRLQTQFARAGLNPAAYLQLRPWADAIQFNALTQRSDLMLDTIGFSGFNTVVHALQSGLPIVTQRGEFLRGRFGSGILEHLALPELVAENHADFVDRVERIVRDRAFDEQIRERIREERARLYGDESPMAALGEFLIRCGAGSTS
jgi:hypothetical protein